MANKVDDLTGKKFGRLTVIKRCGYTNGKRKLITWLCKCECGNTAIRTGKALKDSKNSGCDKCRWIYEDLTGKKFGALTVVSIYGSKDGEVIWNCMCECGNMTIASTGKLNFGSIISCGCVKRNRIIERSKTHGLSNTRLYEIWCGMKKRCYNKSSESYDDYGGRGIDICEEWKQDFKKFYDWAMSHGYKENLSIERKNNDKGYSPENCRWATSREQSLNKRNTIYYSIMGINKPLIEWCNSIQMEYGRAYERYYNGNEPFQKDELERIKEVIKNGG